MNVFPNRKWTEGYLRMRTLFLLLSVFRFASASIHPLNVGVSQITRASGVLKWEEVLSGGNLVQRPGVEADRGFTLKQRLRGTPSFHVESCDHWACLGQGGLMLRALTVGLFFQSVPPTSPPSHYPGRSHLFPFTSSWTAHCMWTVLSLFQSSGHPLPGDAAGSTNTLYSKQKAFLLPLAPLPLEIMV